MMDVKLRGALLDCPWEIVRVDHVFRLLYRTAMKRCSLVAIATRASKLIIQERRKNDERADSTRRFLALPFDLFVQKKVQ